MKQGRFNGSIVDSECVNGLRSECSVMGPNYNSKSVQDALQHLASIDLIELCNEAKVEHCRATRDLRSCGRSVEDVLNTCGHASLCAECSQRCDTCPICRTPLTKNGNRLRHRLYYECVEAGLIPKTYNDRFQEKEDDMCLTADVQRLYSLFDVALESNLCCLICQYVTDVCMDENAVSSDPVVAFLLDEVVVKDWCKRTFKSILAELRAIYHLEVGEMKTRMGSLLKYSLKLTGLSNVLEVFDLSFKDTHSAKLDDLHHLQENILKTKQHMEMMIWCIRHGFLEDIRSRYSNVLAWRGLVHERKSAAVQRAWPEAAVHSVEETGQECPTLFVEDALLNFEVEKGYEQHRAVELEVASLQKDGGASFLRAKLEGLGGCYPFENLRSAVDILFLCGNSDMVVAKKAIFTYYLFDRHWTIPDEEWRHIVDDFAATFNITRHSLLESLTFYLLDDHTDEALQEACRLLPEISGPESHPKIGKVLLERQNPDAALMFLRWSGRDGSAKLVSLSEAVTAVRVRVECSLLTEAFMYQRMLCTKVKENQIMHKVVLDATDCLKGESRDWMDWVDALVTEICWLCIRRNLVDRMIELPWNSDEEKYLHKRLLDYATEDPSTNNGSLLVVFYLQRHRYVEAYHVDHKLQILEQDFISNNNVSRMILNKMKSSAQWRAGLVDKCVELLPEVQQQQLKAGKLHGDTIYPENEMESSREPGIADAQETVNAMLSMPSASNSSLILQLAHNDHCRPFNSGISKPDGPVMSSHFEGANNDPPSISLGNFTNSESGFKSPFNVIKGVKFDDMLSPRWRGTDPRSATAVHGFVTPPSRFVQRDFQDVQLADSGATPVEQDVSYRKFTRISPPNSRRVMAKPTRTPSSNFGLVDDSPEERYATASGKRFLTGRSDRPWNSVSSTDAMDVSRSPEENGSAIAADFNMNRAPRWRLDEASEEEDEPSPERMRGIPSNRTPLRGSRRSRLSRR